MNDGIDRPKASKIADPAEQLVALIIEDDELMRERLALIARSVGLDTIGVDCGAAAHQALDERYFPIVLVDRQLPDLDGIVLCNEIRRRNAAQYTYVMLLTAMDANNEIVAGLDAGADDYVSKRVSERELQARLRTAQRIVRLEHALRAALDVQSRSAMTDSLTGEHNRRYFDEHLGPEIGRAKRYGAPLSVLALDIDHFKLVNDSYGHAVGDEVIKEFARRIRSGLPRSFDWVARVGGEEFAVVLPQTNRVGAAVVAERLREAICAAPFVTASGSIPITVSIGVGSLETLSAEITPATLLEQADRYLYRSKLAGRNRVSAPSPT